MNEHNELVKRLNISRCYVRGPGDVGYDSRGEHDKHDGKPVGNVEDERREAAQAIERLEAHNRELADWRTATAVRADKLESDVFDLWLRAEKAERELADARARDEDRQEAIRAVLKVLPTQREPHPDDNLQKLVNLACSLLDDAFTDYAPEALATPAPIETTGKAAVMDPTIAKKQQESG